MTNEQAQKLELLAEELEVDSGIAEDGDPAVLLVSAVKANKALIKQAKAEIRASRREIKRRTALSDFLNKYFPFFR